MDGDIMHAKTKEKAEDRRRRICFLDLMGFHLLQDELMVKKNVKSKGKKKSNWSYFCFLLTPLFCILPSGGFLQARQKKKSCIAWYVISFCCSACVCVCVFAQECSIWKPSLDLNGNFSYTSATSFSFLFSSEWHKQRPPAFLTY